MRPEDRLARRGGAIELLRLPAALFSAAARTRRVLYDRGLLPVTRASVPVISVGNVTTGGTGKTPVCAWFVRELAARGHRPGLLSRGYGAERGESNDEAKLLERLCPLVPHVADKDRVAGAARLVAEHGVTVIVLDDGFQHRRLARDVDLVLIDATRPFGLAAVDGRAPVSALLPRGLLREPPSSLARADALMITRCESVDAAALETLESDLQRLAPGRVAARVEFRPRAWRDERGVESPLASLAGREVDVISALGHPAAFEASVRSTGAIVREHRVFPDHHRYVLDDVKGLPASGRVLVTSGKDAVKLAPLSVAFRSLESDATVVHRADVIAALLDALPNPARPHAIRTERRELT